MNSLVSTSVTCPPPRTTDAYACTGCAGADRLQRHVHGVVGGDQPASPVRYARSSRAVNGRIRRLRAMVSKDLSGPALSVDQIRAVPSALEVRIFDPSGLKAALKTAPVGPSRVVSWAPVRVSQIRAVPSSLAVATSDPSGLNAAPRTGPV